MVKILAFIARFKMKNQIVLDCSEPFPFLLRVFLKYYSLNESTFHNN